MPTLFQGTCRHCGHTTPLLCEVYGAVFADRPVAQAQHEVAGAVLTSGVAGAMASIDDPRFVVLRHPIEDSDLRKTGYSWRDLLKQGRYVRVTNVICRECGTLFRRRRLAPPGGFGCITGLGLGVVAGLAMGIVTTSVTAALLAGYVVATAVSIGAGFGAVVYVRLRFAARASALAAERKCPACGADNAKTVGWGRSVVCPACRQRGLRFAAAGVS